LNPDSKSNRDPDTKHLQQSTLNIIAVFLIVSAGFIIYWFSQIRNPNFLSQISNPGVKKGTNNTELKKNFSILNQKLLPSSQKYERRCSSRIQIFPSRKQAKKALDPASRILDQDSHDCFIFMTFFY
jgi:hypothetical protein